jgi:hypothetical protein
LQSLWETISDPCDAGNARLDRRVKDTICIGCEVLYQEDIQAVLLDSGEVRVKLLCRHEWYHWGEEVESQVWMSWKDRGLDQIGIQSWVCT